jgi:hypothetical protein
MKDEVPSDQQLHEPRISSGPGLFDVSDTDNSEDATPHKSEDETTWFHLPDPLIGTIRADVQTGNANVVRPRPVVNSGGIEAVRL